MQPMPGACGEQGAATPGCHAAQPRGAETNADGAAFSVTPVASKSDGSDLQRAPRAALEDDGVVPGEAEDADARLPRRVRRQPRPKSP